MLIHGVNPLREPEATIPPVFKDAFLPATRQPTIIFWASGKPPKSLGTHQAATPVGIRGRTNLTGCGSATGRHAAAARPASAANGLCRLFEGQISPYSSGVEHSTCNAGVRGSNPRGGSYDTDAAACNPV